MRLCMYLLCLKIHFYWFRPCRKFCIHLQGVVLKQRLRFKPLKNLILIELFLQPRLFQQNFWCLRMEGRTSSSAMPSSKVGTEHFLISLTSLNRLTQQTDTHPPPLLLPLQSRCSTVAWRRRLKRCCSRRSAGTTALWTSSGRRTARRRRWRGCCEWRAQ